MYDFRYNEAVQRGTPDFPIEYYLCDTSNPHFDLPVHWHVEYEIIHVLRGEYPFVLDGKECTLKPETICFIRDGSLHGEGVLKDSSLARPSCLFESVVFNIDFIRSRGFQQDAFLHNVVHHEVAIKPFVTEKDAEIYYALIALFKAMKKKNEGYQLLTAGMLQQFFGLVQEHAFYVHEAGITVQNQKRTDQLKSVMELIQTKYATQITLEDMAGIAGMSPKYFCKVFKTMTHKSPIEYLNIYRIEQACWFLRSSKDELMTIAYNCGFNDFSYFIRIFKKYKGTTPLKYRNQKELPAQDNPSL